MYDSHGNAVRVDPSQLRKVKGGYELMEATLSGPSSQQQKPQQRRASGIPQRVPAKIVRPQEARVQKVNMLAPRTPHGIPSTPDTVQSKLSGASTRTISVRRSPTTYWHGIPYMHRLFMKLAISKGWEVRKGAARVIDEEETAAAVKDAFLEETGIRLRVRELGRPLPILAFYSNREMDGVTQRQKYYIRRFLQELGYAKDFPLVWYSKKD
ncbi:hypothetical protein K466DRAFT_591598 [Polyporus arcularius HHB13444]|uniref:Uncharacterized protein n=1 Tax=Polyporus arcularius HHB13444 TaxID=1314778 RepID=A0A5C3NTP0_9APHY|nr:hypothetical protein K466DRAFT_591598 [Polyporus arcularius HHB13444]